MSDRKVMDPKTAATYLRLAAQTLARWRVEGGGPPYLKLGGLVRYREEDLERWLDAHARLSTADPRSSDA